MFKKKKIDPTSLKIEELERKIERIQDANRSFYSSFENHKRIVSLLMTEYFELIYEDQLNNALSNGFKFVSYIDNKILITKKKS